MLHENPVLPRSQIGAAETTLPPAIRPATLWRKCSARQACEPDEMIKITPTTMGREEMAWIWTALKAELSPHFRLRRFGGPARVSLWQVLRPCSVLSPNISVQAGSTAPGFQIQLPGGEAAALPGDTVDAGGQFAAGTVLVLMVHQRMGAQPPINTFSRNQRLSLFRNYPTTHLRGLHAVGDGRERRRRSAAKHPWSSDRVGANDSIAHFPRRRRPTPRVH